MRGVMISLLLLFSLVATLVTVGLVLTRPRRRRLALPAVRPRPEMPTIEPVAPRPRRRCVGLPPPAPIPEPLPEGRLGEAVHLVPVRDPDRAPLVALVVGSLSGCEPGAAGGLDILHVVGICGLAVALFVQLWQQRH